MGKFFNKKKKDAHEDNYGEDDIDQEEEEEIPVPLPTKSDIKKPVTNQAQQQRIVEVAITNELMNEKLNYIMATLQGLSVELKSFKEEALK